MKPPARIINWASLIGTLTAIAAGLVGCSPKYPMDTLSNGSDFARRIHWMYLFVNWIDFIIMLIVLAVMFLAIFWFSTRVGEPGEPSTETSDIRLEIAWTAIPALILVFITVPTIRTIWATQPDHWSPETLTIKVKHRSVTQVLLAFADGDVYVGLALEAPPGEPIPASDPIALATAIDAHVHTVTAATGATGSTGPSGST